jgi:hypothetical protein
MSAAISSARTAAAVALPNLPRKKHTQVALPPPLAPVPPLPRHRPPWPEPEPTRVLLTHCLRTHEVGVQHEFRAEVAKLHAAKLNMASVEMTETLGRTCDPEQVWDAFHLRLTQGLPLDQFHWNTPAELAMASTLWERLFPPVALCGFDNQPGQCHPYHVCCYEMKRLMQEVLLSRVVPP